MAARGIVCSVVNLWELMLKRQKHDSLVSDPRTWWLQYVTQAGIRAIEIGVVHAMILPDLPKIHGDPFDRMLIAQAIVEDLPLVTKDSTLAKYGVQVIW
jgi:PIN domain nuclease of toxin-antitoxin system